MANKQGTAHLTRKQSMYCISVATGFSFEPKEFSDSRIDEAYHNTERNGGYYE